MNRKLIAASRATILACYLRHEKRLGGPDTANEAIRAAAAELGIQFSVVFETVLYSNLMAGGLAS